MNKLNIFNPPKMIEDVSILVGESIVNMIESFKEQAINNGMHEIDVWSIEDKLTSNTNNYTYEEVVSILFSHVKNNEESHNLRVWWIPQVGMSGDPYYVYVSSFEEGVFAFNTLANYDLYQYENRIKSDYANMGGLEYFDNTEKEWLEYCNFDGYTMTEILALEEV